MCSIFLISIYQLYNKVMYMLLYLQYYVGRRRRHNKIINIVKNVNKSLETLDVPI